MSLPGYMKTMESRLKSESITWAIDNLFAQVKYYTPAVYRFAKEKRGLEKMLE